MTIFLLSSPLSGCMCAPHFGERNREALHNGRCWTSSERVVFVVFVVFVVVNVVNVARRRVRHGFTAERDTFTAGIGS